MRLCKNKQNFSINAKVKYTKQHFTKYEQIVKYHVYQVTVIYCTRKATDATHPNLYGTSLSCSLRYHADCTLIKWETESCCHEFLNQEKQNEP